MFRLTYATCHCLIAFVMTTVLIGAAEDTTPPVAVGPRGRLVYQPDAAGNVVPDFSLAGYRQGGVPLPEVRVVETLQPRPGSGDDSARIQAAVNRVAALPERSKDGVRGAVLLARGAWRCTATVRIPAGVVLRGEGQGPDGTVITAAMRVEKNGDKPTLLRLEGRGGVEYEKAEHAVLDATVPLGARRLRITKASVFKPGDQVAVEFRPNESWIRDLRMDQIKQFAPNGRQWTAQDYVLRWQARVVAVAGNMVTLDTPVISSLERRYGSAVLLRSTADRRGRGAAVERLRLISTYATGKENSDEDHAWNAIFITGLVDCWVREVTALHFAYSCVQVAQNAARITVQDCPMLDPVSQLAGGRRYSFVGGGQYVLFQRCYARNGRHDFVTGAKDMGPTVYLDCLAEKTHADIGPHHRWSCGQLYDHVRGGEICIQDRGGMGTGHGWAGNCQVFWNCESTGIVCQKPWLPSAQNWAIGCVGAKGRSAFTDRPQGYWDSYGKHVAPRSLYLNQLAERYGARGEEVIRAVTIPEQREGTIWTLLHRRYGDDR